MENDKPDSPESLSGKVCGVCGDKALGFNFNAVTCESCKAFFRRNAVSNKDFRCPFSEHCEITVVTRRFCQKCRLDKCFSIGMRKEYIMTEEAKVLKRKKIEENRAKKRHNNNIYDDASYSKIKREETSEDSDVWIDHSKEFNDKTSQNIEHSPKPLTPISVIMNNMHELRDLPNVHVDYDLHTKSIGNNAYSEVPDAINAEHDINKSSQYKVGNLDMSESEITAIGNNGQFDQNSPMIRSMLDLSGNSKDNPIFTTLTNKQPNCEAARPEKLHSQLNGRSNGVDVARDILQDVQRIQIEPNSIESILCEAIKLEFEAYGSLSQINNSSRELNDAERAKLNELIVANKALYAPLDEDLTTLVADECRLRPNQNEPQDPALLGVINLTAVAIRRLIKMAKRISAFKNMCQEDQVALLKGGCTEMMILRSAMTYDCDRDTWKIPHIQEAMSNIKADVLKLAKGNIYKEHERFIRTFDQRWRMDENIILIMSAITLFTPDRPKVVHSDVIKLEQNSYYYLLRRYLESVYAGCEAKSTFLKLIQKISELHRLNDEVIGVYLDVNPLYVEPLLIEIFDLKSH